ncbi:hypothetical protein GCM10011312_13240 [Planktosalinus lacus]|uniref:DUF4476 domain-containing protein n=2 Tax=Planktosalinus lacus TaxID=1526573 RepID=A0A8J2Y9T6_9FLAO|nr:hypothetical protein GCM10011312_13240 [Planktosalinus lacus]
MIKYLNLIIMKLKLLISTLFLFVLHFGHSQQRDASLQVEFENSRASFTIQIGELDFQVDRNILFVEGLPSGFHEVLIFEIKRNRRVLVYRGGINLARNATTFSFFRNRNFEVYAIEPHFVDDPVIVEVPVISNEMFNQLKSTVQNESFDSGRLELLESTLRNNNFTSHQIKELLHLLSFDSGRLQFAKSAYTQVVDPENYFVVNEALSYSSSKSELLKYINSMPGN